MRVVLAALFVFAGVLLAVGLLPDVLNRVSSILVGLGLAVLFLALVAIALILFNRPQTGLSRIASAEAYTKTLDGKGLLVSTHFNAVRAYQVEEYEDEGLHYFLELEGEGVLYLNGQYLYDYETVEDDHKYSHPKSFPCTRFTIRRHRDEGFVVDILCGGSLLETETAWPAFQQEDYRRGKVPEDGDILTSKSFNELKSRLGQAR